MDIAGFQAPGRWIYPPLENIHPMSSDSWSASRSCQGSRLFKPARIELSIEGLDMNEFVNWFRNRCQKNESHMLAAQPEHWVVSTDGNVEHKVIENLGPWVSRFVIKFEPPSQPFQKADIYDDYPLRLSGYGFTDDGAVHGYVLHQFRPHENGTGFDANFCIYYPASAPEILFEQHRQHLVVEFTNWTRHCYQELKVEKLQI